MNAEYKRGLIDGALLGVWVIVALLFVLTFAGCASSHRAASTTTAGRAVVPPQLLPPGMQPAVGVFPTPAAALPRPAAPEIALPPGKPTTNGLQINVPANGGNNTNRLYWRLQSTHDFVTWFTITNFEALSGYSVTNNVASTNVNTFYRLQGPFTNQP